jgi:hypothetical protein
MYIYVHTYIYIYIYLYSVRLVFKTNHHNKLSDDKGIINSKMNEGSMC